MDYVELAKASGVVFVIMFIAGVIISILSTVLQCGKTGFGVAALRGIYAAAFPTIVYALARRFTGVRHPFSSTFEGFGIDTATSDIVGLGYLVMLASWVSVVSNINQSEKLVCKPDLKEMTDFKKKMMADLLQKEKDKQANAEKKS